MLKSLILFFVLLSIVWAQNSEDAYFRMKRKAYYLYEHKQQKEAIVKVQEFIQKYPDSIRGKNLLAVFYFWQGEKEKAKELLIEILQKQSFTQAKRLLATIDAKALKQVLKNRSVISTKQKSKQKTPSKKRKKEVKDGIQSDLSYLLEHIKKDPANIVDRKFLAHYFVSVNNYEKAKKMAMEVLKIQPDDAEMLSLLKEADMKVVHTQTKELLSSEKRDKVMDILAYYYEQKAYYPYLNLYKALRTIREYIPTYVHLNALEASIMTKEYLLAKEILDENRFEETKHLSQLKELLKRKSTLATLDL